MADIGATLRDARMRQRIDISEIESRDEDPCEVSARAGERGVGPAAGAHVRQELPAHVRRGARARRQAAHRGVQAPPRAPLRRRDAADPPRRRGPRPAAAPARPGREPRLGRPRRRVRDRRRALLPRHAGARRQRAASTTPSATTSTTTTRARTSTTPGLDDLGPLARRGRRRQAAPLVRLRSSRPAGLRLPASRRRRHRRQRPHPAAPARASRPTAPSASGSCSATARPACGSTARRAPCRPDGRDPRLRDHAAGPRAPAARPATAELRA